MSYGKNIMKCIFTLVENMAKLYFGEIGRLI